MESKPFEGFVQLAKYNDLYEYPKIQTIRCWMSQNFHDFNNTGIIKRFCGKQYVNVDKLLNWRGETV